MEVNDSRTDVVFSTVHCFVIIIFDLMLNLALSA